MRDSFFFVQSESVKVDVVSGADLEFGASFQFCVFREIIGKIRGERWMSGSEESHSKEYECWHRRYLVHNTNIVNY